MACSQSISFGALLTLLLATFVNGLAISYCSSDNTASSEANYSQYQSNGLCQTTCADFAYAVLQGSNCWCSDYAPSQQVNTLDCNEPCPGYPNDWCGSESAGLYGYYQLSVAPSGTADGGTTPTSASVSPSPSTPASSSSSTSSSSFTSTVAPPVSSTASSRTATSSSVDVAPSTGSSQTPTPQTSTSSPGTTDPPTQVYTSVMTVTGIITTVVISGTPTATGEPSSLGQGATNKAGISTGKVVGIVLGVALGLGLVIGLAVWLWLRRKHQNQSRGSSRNGGFSGEDADTSRTTPSRQVSQLSSSGLLGKGPRILTNGYSLSNDFNNPRSPNTMPSNGVDRRSMGTDQRLNPYALYAHEEAHLSSVSLQDNQDYSRQLRVANPD